MIKFRIKGNAHVVTHNDEMIIFDSLKSALTYIFNLLGKGGRNDF